MGRPFVNDDASKEAAASAQQELVNEWLDKLREANVQDTPELKPLLEWLATKQRTAYVPKAEPMPEAAAQAPASTDTKMGGLPYLLPGEAWPCCSDEHGLAPMTFIMQLQLQELPAAVRHAVGAEEGLLQVFLNEELPGFNINTDFGYYLVRLLKPEEQQPRLPSDPPVAPPPGVRLLEEKRVLEWEAVTDYPNFEDLQDMQHEVPGDPGAVQELLNHIYDLKLCRPKGGEKLVGWPNWCQSPEWGVVEGQQEQRFTHVLQIEGRLVDIEIGDMGTMVVQVHPSDPYCWRLGWACC